MPNILVCAGHEQEDLAQGTHRHSSSCRCWASRRWSPRAFEFPALQCCWDSNAYGSITWTLLGLHTTHLITDLADTLVWLALMFTRHGDNRRRFGDVQDNAMYWNFVVLTWLPIYACLYWVPRL